MCCHVLSCNCLKNLHFFLPSILARLLIGKGNKSKGVNGLKSYTISNSENLVVEWTVLLEVNSTCGKHYSQVFKFFRIMACNKVGKVLFTTSVRPSVYG